MDHIDIQCILHTKCNMHCKFCYETKHDGSRLGGYDINIDYINNLPNIITDTVVPVMKENHVNTILIDIMGGELFSDNITDDTFVVYRNFAFLLKRKLKNLIPDVRCDFYSISNGLFTRHSRVYDFLKSINSHLILSYDPHDRFDDEQQKHLWCDTFNYFKNSSINTEISVLLTKENMNAYINGDEIYETVSKKVYVQHNIYSPGIDYSDHLPGDDDIFAYYRWIIDNTKFSILDTRVILLSWIRKQYVPSCDQKHDFIFAEYFKNRYNQEYIYDCVEESELGNKCFYGKNYNKIPRNSECFAHKKSIGMVKRGCLYCEHQSYCPKMCWKQILFDKYQITECPIKRVYEYIKQHPEIVNKFNKWRNCHEKD